MPYPSVAGKWGSVVRLLNGLATQSKGKGNWPLNMQQDAALVQQQLNELSGITDMPTGRAAWKQLIRDAKVRHCPKWCGGSVGC